MTNKFENKSADEIAEDIFQNTETASQVDAAFEDLKSLNTAVRKGIVDTLEKLVIKDTGETMEELQFMVGPIGKRTEAALAMFEDDGDLANAQSVCQIFLHVAQIKGDEAAPATKAVINELSALSDKAYNSYPKLTVAVATAFNKAASAEKASNTPQTPNPFNKKSGGPKI